MIKQATISVNQHIDSLKDQLNQIGSSQLDYLIIAHPDHQMLGQLKQAFEKSSIAVIALPQNFWCMEDTEVSELIDWAVGQLNVQGILLVGHSQGGTPKDNLQVCPAGNIERNGASNRFNSLFEQVEASQQCVRENEKHFVNELKSLQKQKMIESGSLRKKDLLQGLFYRAESGVFCLYDLKNDAFQALMCN